MKVQSFVILGAFVALAGYGGGAVNEKAAAKRDEIVADYRLTPKQSGFYDGCLKALRSYSLKNGHAKEPTCGCLAKRVVNESEVVSYEVELMTSLVKLKDKKGRFDDGQDYSADYFDAMTRMAEAMSACVDEPGQGASLSRPAALKAYCAKAPDPAACRQHVE